MSTSQVFIPNHLKIGGFDRAFASGLPCDRPPASPGNGQMVALLAPNRATVDRYAPGLRQHLPEPAP